MIPPRHLPIVLVSGLAALSLLAGCGTSGESGRAEKAGSFDPSAPWANFPSTEPSATILSYWRLIQIGAYPAALSGYDPGVVQTVGAKALLEVLALQRSGIATLKPKVIAERSVDGGKVVAVEARNSAGNGGVYSFAVRRRDDGRWVIVYESLMGDSMPAAYARAIERRTRGAANPGVPAIREGDRLAEAYRAAALTTMGRGVVGAAHRKRTGPPEK